MMKFVKGRPLQRCSRSEDAGWYLFIDGKMETFEFADGVLTEKMAKIIFDPHNENKRISGYVRIAINSIPIIQMEMLLGERNGWYMNRVGGMCPSLYNKEEEIEAKNWPQENRIKVSRWPNGVHWFAKVDGIDVVDEEGNVKWNTAEAAEEAAEVFLRDLSEEVLVTKGER